jgi:hypothetical protein
MISLLNAGKFASVIKLSSSMVENSTAKAMSWLPHYALFGSRYSKYDAIRGNTGKC